MPKMACTNTDTIRFYGYEHPLSIFYLSALSDNNGLLYRSSEIYYQSKKSFDIAIQEQFSEGEITGNSEEDGQTYADSFFRCGQFVTFLESFD